MNEILITSSNTWLGKLIRWFTNSKCNHCGIMYWVHDELSNGLQLTSFIDYLNSNKKLLIRTLI